MDVLEIIKKRRSIRDFMDQCIPEDAVDDLMEALRWAPSAGNLQSRKFYFVFNESLRKKLAGSVGNPELVARVKKLAKKMLNRNFVSKAPLIVVACLDHRISRQYGERGVLLYTVQDVAASIMNMMLVAHELGLGSVWIGGFGENEVTEAMRLPEHLRPVALIPIGYPASVPTAPSRKSGDEVAELVF